MGAKNAYPGLNFNPSTKRVAVQWYPNGTSSPTSIHGRGVASVSRESTGTFKIVLEDNWRTVIPHAPQLVSAAHTGVTWVVTSISDGLRGASTVATVTLACRNNGVLINLAAGTTEIVNFVADCCDSRTIESTY